EKKRTSSGFLVGLCAMIGSTDCADSRNRHLSGERTFHLMIHQSLQGKRTQRLALVVARFRQSMLHLSKCLKGALQVSVRLDGDGDGSLNIHAKILPHISLPCTSHVCGHLRQFPNMA